MTADEDAALILDEGGHQRAQRDAYGRIGTDGYDLLPSIYEGRLRVIYRFHWSWKLDGHEGRRADNDLHKLHASRLDAYTTALQERGWTVEHRIRKYVGDSYLRVAPPSDIPPCT